MRKLELTERNSKSHKVRNDMHLLKNMSMSSVTSSFKCLCMPVSTQKAQTKSQNKPLA